MKLNCYIVRDLLPSYIKDLTSEATSEDVKRHLANCKDCQETYENMSCAMEDTHTEETELSVWLKKIIKTYFAKLLLGVALLLFVFSESWVTLWETTPSCSLKENFM